MCQPYRRGHHSCAVRHRARRLHTPAPPHITCVVRRGDNRRDVANRFDTKVEAIIQLSGLASSLIYSGTQQRIPSAKHSVMTPTTTPAPSDRATPRPSAPTPKPAPPLLDECSGVYVGMQAEHILGLWGDPRSRELGRDDDAVVAWFCQDGKDIYEGWETGGVIRYWAAKTRLPQLLVPALCHSP